MPTALGINGSFLGASWSGVWGAPHRVVSGSFNSAPIRLYDTLLERPEARRLRHILRVLSDHELSEIWPLQDRPFLRSYRNLLCLLWSILQINSRADFSHLKIYYWAPETTPCQGLGCCIGGSRRGVFVPSTCLLLNQFSTDCSVWYTVRKVLIIPFQRSIIACMKISIDLRRANAIFDWCCIKIKV